MRNKFLLYYDKLFISQITKYVLAYALKYTVSGVRRSVGYRRLGRTSILL